MTLDLEATETVRAVVAKEKGATKFPVTTVVVPSTRVQGQAAETLRLKGGERPDPGLSREESTGGIPGSPGSPPTLSHEDRRDRLAGGDGQRAAQGVVDLGGGVDAEGPEHGGGDVVGATGSAAG